MGDHNALVEALYRAPGLIQSGAGGGYYAKARILGTDLERLLESGLLRRLQRLELVGLPPSTAIPATWEFAETLEYLHFISCVEAVDEQSSVIGKFLGALSAQRLTCLKLTSSTAMAWPVLMKFSGLRRLEVSQPRGPFRSHVLLVVPPSLKCLVVSDAPLAFWRDEFGDSLKLEALVIAGVTHDISEMILPCVPANLQHLTVRGRLSSNFARALKEAIKGRLKTLTSIDLSGVDESTIGDYRTKAAWRDRLLKHQSKVHVVIDALNQLTAAFSPSRLCTAFLASQPTAPSDALVPRRGVDLRDRTEAAQVDPHSLGPVTVGGRSSRIYPTPLQEICSWFFRANLPGELLHSVQKRQRPDFAKYQLQLLATTPTSYVVKMSISTTNSPKDNRSFALKFFVLHPNGSLETEAQRQTFAQEVRKDVQILQETVQHHPHIVDVYCLLETVFVDPVRDEVPLDGGVTYPFALVMPYIDAAPFSAGHSKFHEHVRQLASALEYMHSKGVSHRDVKPSNVVIDKTTDSLTLLDFAHLRERSDACTTVYGTPTFMAPEVLTQTPYDPFKADVFSFGKTLKNAFSRTTLPMPLGLRDISDACTKSIPEARPTMTRILQQLSGADISTC